MQVTNDGQNDCQKLTNHSDIWLVSQLIIVRFLLKRIYLTTVRSLVKRMLVHVQIQLFCLTRFYVCHFTVELLTAEYKKEQRRERD